MAEFVFKDGSIVVNSVDLSDHARSITISYDADMVDSTAMGDDDREFLAGLRSWNISVEFEQDYAASKVDATLFPLVGAAAFTTTVSRPSGGRGTIVPSIALPSTVKATALPLPARSTEIW